VAYCRSIVLGVIEPVDIDALVPCTGVSTGMIV